MENIPVCFSLGNSIFKRININLARWVLVVAREIFTICAKRYGCSLFLVDNLMSVLCSPEEENKAQARFVAKLKAFATKFNVHVILVAHPRKEKTGTVFTSDSVSGSSAITNLADIVLTRQAPLSMGFSRQEY